MKNLVNVVMPVTLLVAAMACEKTKQQEPLYTEVSSSAGQSAVKDEESQKNIVQTAVTSPEHKILVAALQAAKYSDALSNAGPFTVFAPTDEAFSKLPDGTIDNLVKPENISKLQDILEYHVYVGVIRESMIQDKLTLNQVNGKNVTLVQDDRGLTVNDARIVATGQTSNGIIYVIDKVLLP